MGGTYKAPDIAAANREAVMASIETFPLQREIEAASRIGAKVRVPIYKDGKETGQFREVDFGPVSDIAQTRAIGQALADLAPIQAQRELEAAKLYGTQFADQRRRELQALDPERYGTAAVDGRPGTPGLYSQFLSDIGRAPISETSPAAPSYERVGMPTGPQDTGYAQSIRSDLERQIGAGLAQAGTLDPTMIRAAEQAARARGTATGNILGNLSAFREARAVNEAISNADVQRRQQAIGLLQSGQTTSDVANRQAQEAFSNILAATGQRNTAMQQSFAGQMSAQQQQQAGRQQNIANIQSALGLQPIVSQAAQLGGLQQGASPFAAPQLMQGMQQAGPGQLMQMGSSFALQNAQNAFQASQAGSPLAMISGITGGLQNLGSAYGSGGFNLAGSGGCYVARECIPDQWEAFYFWKELVGPKWFKSFYDSNAEKFAKWLKNKPKTKKIVANWMLGRIKSLVPKA
jgi:hypothetical protein